MESSSENSFAWTDTSNDSVSSTSMTGDDINGNSDENCTLNDDYGKQTKGKKSRIKHNEESVDFKPKLITNDKYETKSNSSLVTKMIKTEPDSENDLHKNKKKIRHTETNGNQNEDSMSYDETYLNMKVKQEEASASSTKHKRKKRKRTSSIDSTTTTKLKNHESYQNNSSHEINNTYVTLKQESENDTETSKSKKKKKKSKKHYDSDEHDLEIEDKIDIGETVVNKHEETRTKHSKGKHADISVSENNTQQEESEESGCDEISAIKCDSDHSLHTVSFIDKSTKDENTKINCNNSLNIITQPADMSVLEQDSVKKLEAAKHRTQRISDRIRFEDDDDSNIESSQVEHEDYSVSDKKLLKLKQFQKKNPNLKQPPQTFNNNTNLTRDDEIWILKCPKEINVNDFNNTTLNIHGKCKIKVGGQTYEGSAEEEQSNIISVLTMEHSRHKIKNVLLSGTINLRKRIPKAHYRDDNIMVNNQTNFIPLPETKCRHPLFGSNYKKALKIPTAIAARLNMQDSEETLMRTENKKKKNKKDKNTLEQIEHAQSDIMMKSEPEHSVKDKKKKKRKIIDDEGPAPKKVRRIKHDPESAEAWESEKAIEENLFNF